MRTYDVFTGLEVAHFEVVQQMPKFLHRQSIALAHCVVNML